MTDRRTDGPTDGWKDKASCKDAWMHLKMIQSANEAQSPEVFPIIAKLKVNVANVFVFLSVRLYLCLPSLLIVCLSVSLPVCLSVCLSAYVCLLMSVCLSVNLSFRSPLMHLVPLAKCQAFEEFLSVQKAI